MKVQIKNKEPIDIGIKLLKKEEDSVNSYTGILKINKRDYAFKYKNNKCILKTKLPMNWGSDAKWEFREILTKYITKELKKMKDKNIEIKPTKNARLNHMKPADKLSALYDLKIQIQDKDEILSTLKKQRSEIVTKIRSLAQEVGEEKRKLIEWI